MCGRYRSSLHHRPRSSYRCAHCPQIADIVAFELGLSTAQIYDFAAGSLQANGALGGPANLLAQQYYPGINDSLGADPRTPFDARSMTLFTAWSNSYRKDGSFLEEIRAAAQREIAAGEAIFNSTPL